MTVAASRSGLTFAALALALILIYTGISAGEKLTWLMEVTPVIIIVPLLLATRSRYPLTTLLYVLIFFHAIILMVGGMYTYAAREILLRGGYVHGRKMLAFVVCCIALAISAVYELIEWWAALALGQGADDFLGTQGDPWDTQSDMFCALLGALTTVFALGRWHTKQLLHVQRI